MQVTNKQAELEQAMSTFCEPGDTADVTVEQAAMAGAFEEHAVGEEDLVYPDAEMEDA